MLPPSLSLAVCLFMALPVHAQTLYRCQDGQKVTYADRPCVAGAEKQIPVDGRPSAEEARAAKARQQRRLEQEQAQRLVRERRKAEDRKTIKQDVRSDSATANPVLPDNDKVGTQPVGARR